MSKTKTRPRPAPVATTHTLTATEALSHCVMSVLGGLGCQGLELKTAVRAICFGLARSLVIEARDANNFTMADFIIDIDAEKMRLMTSSGQTYTIDPSKPVYGQVSRILGKVVPDLNALWHRLGATRRVVCVVYPDDVYENPELLERTRVTLGLVPSDTDWNGKTPTAVGSFSPGNMQALGFTARVGR